MGANDQQGLIEGSFTGGVVIGGVTSGGLVGNNSNMMDRASVLRSYSHAMVAGAGAVGGLVGTNKGNLEQSFATGRVRSRVLPGSVDEPPPSTSAGWWA